MTLPTKTDLQTMDYSYGGVPFVSVATKAGIDLDTLDYSYAGVPFWGLEVNGDVEVQGTVSQTLGAVSLSAAGTTVSSGTQKHFLPLLGVGK